MEKTFNQWNMNVMIFHNWLLRKDTCLLCNSIGPCIVADSKAICAACLTQFPNVPWHPTGAIRPKLETLVRHILTGCGSHQTSAASLIASLSQGPSENSSNNTGQPFQLS